MTNSMCEPMPTLMIAAEPADRAELARGPLVRDQVTGLLARLQPLVRERNVALDLACVDRIDAAGITALVGLYRDARQSGHRFSVTNASARVAQILSVVGLDRILLSHNAVRNAQFGPRISRSAA
jgi:anti-anti-sigma factor